MSVTSLVNTPCTVIRRVSGGEEDDYGNEIPTIEEVASVCEVQKQIRRSSEEPEAEGELSDTLWLGIFLAGEDLTTADAIDVDGLGRMELIGAPWPVRNPRTQSVSHIEANLRLTAGAEDAS